MVHIRTTVSYRSRTDIDASRKGSTMQIRPTQHSAIFGDPNAGTRLAGFDTWELQFGEPLSATPYHSHEAARGAAVAASQGEAPTVAVLHTPNGFEVLPVFYADNWRYSRALPKDPVVFTLHDVLDTISTGGSLEPAPTTELVELVDGPDSAHIVAQDGHWGFSSGVVDHDGSPVPLPHGGPHR
jgi:hypothetical protein